MSKIKRVDTVLRLKKPMSVKLDGVKEVINFKLGEEFHIVADVLYMNGYMVPPNMQKILIKWIDDNPNLFVNDTRRL